MSNLIKQIETLTAPMSYERTLENGNDRFTTEIKSDYCATAEITSETTAIIEIARDNGSYVQKIDVWLNEKGKLDYPDNDWGKWHS